jgi:hypothetical protein
MKAYETAMAGGFFGEAVIRISFPAAAQVVRDPVIRYALRNPAPARLRVP